MIRMKLQAEHAKDRTDILGIMARAEHEFQESEADAKHEYSSVKDDVKNKVSFSYDSLGIEPRREACT